MIYSLVTIDYELFGNGTGDLIKSVIEPTNAILDICEKYNAKLTIFFDVCEYWAFQKAFYDRKLTFLKYNPAKITIELTTSNFMISRCL